MDSMAIDREITGSAAVLPVFRDNVSESLAMVPSRIGCGAVIRRSYGPVPVAPIHFAPNTGLVHAFRRFSC